MVTLSSGKYQNNCAEENLKGPVKSCIMFLYESRNKENLTDSDYWIKESIIYNHNGNEILGIVSRNPWHGKKDIYESFTGYDKMGREAFKKDKSGKIISRSLYGFNKGHMLVETILSNTALEIIYNKAGFPDTIYDITNRNNIALKNTFIYNKAYNRIEEVGYTNAGYVNYKIKSTYNSKHQLTEEVTYQNATENEKAYKTKSTITYDSFGNLLTELDSNTMRVDGYSCAVNNKPESEHYTLMNCKYSNFDKYQNWLRKDFICGNSILATTKRQIKYYKK